MVLQGGELRGIVLICSWAPNNSWYLQRTRYNDVVSPTGIAEIRKKPKMNCKNPLSRCWMHTGEAGAGRIDILIASTWNTFLLWYVSERAEITTAPNMPPTTRRPLIMPGTRVESMPNYLWMHPIACTSCPGPGTGA